MKSVKAFVGISFDRTNPEGICNLIDNGRQVVIVDVPETYHPKIYFFRSADKMAAIIGSSNFTYSGFSENIEANILIEGKAHQRAIKDYLTEIRKSIHGCKQIIPDDNWLKAYRRKYEAQQRRLSKSKIKEESAHEEELKANSSWLAIGDWNFYMLHINRGILRHKSDYRESLKDKLAMLVEYEKTLKTPWTVVMLDDIANRRRIWGMNQYGWLGHVGASPRMMQLLASGSVKERGTIVKSINRIAKLEMPLDYGIIKAELCNLVKLGPTIKVWSRLLAITRPDTYCTFSSPFVSKKLSNLLDRPQSYFKTVDAYIDVLKLIHQSRWFNSTKPKDEFECDIWLRRVAFLDVVLY